MTIERLRVLEAKATSGPWADLTKAFNEGCAAYKKRTRKNWHSPRGRNKNSGDMALHLIAQAKVRGEFVTPETIPAEVDWWDLHKIACLRWSELRDNGASAGTFIEEQDRALIVAARNAMPALLKIAEQAKLAVESGAIDEIYLSTIRDALADLERVA